MLSVLPRRSAWAWVLLCLACLQSLAASGSTQWILCLGDDGHVELEVGIDGKCGGRESAWIPGTPAGRAPSLADADHCGPCWDVAWMAWDDCAPKLADQPSSLTAIPVLIERLPPAPAFSFAAVERRYRDRLLGSELRQSSPASVRLLI